MKKTIIIFLVIFLGLQTTVYSRVDTVYNRCARYYYTSWYDSCYAAGANSTYISDLVPGNPCVGNYQGSGIIKGAYQYTSVPLEIIGVVGGVIKTEFTDPYRMPEYFMVYDDINGQWVLVDSARWDTAEVKYLALETQTTHTRYREDTINGVDTVLEYIETVQETKYMKICEAYFKAPIVVNDSFLLGATSFNNVRPATGEPSYDCAGYIHEPTEYPTNFYSNCFRYSPVWQQFDGVWQRGRLDEYNGYYYIIFPIIKVLDTFQIIGSSYDETQGTVNGSGDYLKNSTVVLTAIPNEGYKFTMWNDSVTTNPRTIIASQDTAFTAYFAPLEQYIVSVESNDPLQGTVSGGGTYYETTTAVLTATPNEGYKFTMWNDSVTDNPRTIIASQDTAFTAYFAPLEQYTVSVESNDPLQGTVSGGGTYYETTTAVLTATPNEGYKFTMWNDSVTDNPRNIVVSQDTLFTAYFEVKIGINEAGNNAELFTISPNPTTNNLQISIGESGNYTMEIYSANGTMVRQEQINHSSTVDVSTLSAGNYFIKIYNGTTTGIRAFVKQ